MRFTYWASLANVGLVCVVLSACSGDGGEDNGSAGGASGAGSVGTSGTGGGPVAGQGGVPSSTTAGTAGTAGVTTGGTTSGSGGTGSQCKAPANPLPCTQTSGCSNYPQTFCGQNGFCVCGEDGSGGSAGEPGTGGSGNHCTPPANPLACQSIQDCGNYPETICGQNGFCVCGEDGSGGSAGEPGTGGSGNHCTPPANPLACQSIQDCGNYPQAICGQGFCVCP